MRNAIQSTRNLRRGNKKIHRHARACKSHRTRKAERENPLSLVPARTPLCAARHKGEIISAGRVISRQSRRLSLAYQSRMHLFFFFSLSSPSLPSPTATGAPPPPSSDLLRGHPDGPLVSISSRFSWTFGLDTPLAPWKICANADRSN